MARTPESAAHGGQPGVQQDRDVNIRAILGFGLGLIVLAIAIHLVVWVLFGYFDGREAVRGAPEYPLAIGLENRQPPEPRLQTHPRDDLRALRAHEDELLGSYGWIDKPAGIVRIPIDEAMKITAQRGLPVRPATGDRK